MTTSDQQLAIVNVDPRDRLLEQIRGIEQTIGDVDFHGNDWQVLSDLNHELRAIFECLERAEAEHATSEAVAE